MTSSSPNSTDPRAALARALAETHLERVGAEHDYQRLINEGSDHMHSRYPASTLDQQPDQLDHFAWHMEAMSGALETGGIAPIPDLPYTPAQPGSD